MELERLMSVQPQLFGNWTAPASMLTIDTLDCHTAGEPLRIITKGFPILRGASMLARRRDCMEQHDALRKALMFEPRGHADMYGALITPPEREDSHFGALFMHNEGYSTMCGHAMIALTRTAIEAGVVEKKEPTTTFCIDVPCGQIRVFAEIRQGVIEDISFENVASFVQEMDCEIEVQGIGPVTYSLAYGGAFYAYVDAASIGLSLAMENHRQIIDYGMRIKKAVMARQTMAHPFEPDLNFLYGTIFSDRPSPASSPQVHSRNVCIFADGELDRSPTGSGVSGQIAILMARGAVSLGQQIVIESILGTQFRVSAVREEAYGPYFAVIPRVAGEAYVTGQHQFLIDPQDPLKQGFIFK